LEIRFCCYSTA